MYVSNDGWFKMVYFMIDDRHVIYVCYTFG